MSLASRTNHGGVATIACLLAVDSWVWSAVGRISGDLYENVIADDFDLVRLKILRFAM